MSRQLVIRQSMGCKSVEEFDMTVAGLKAVKVETGFLLAIYREGKESYAYFTDKEGPLGRGQARGWMTIA